MMERFVGELVNFITANQYVNLHSSRFTRERKDRKSPDLERLHAGLLEEYGNFLIDIDIKGFDACEAEEDEALVFLESVNRELRKINSMESIPNAISIAGALEKLSKKFDELKERALLVFHCFSDIHDEKEKDILRSLRKFIEIFKGSVYLGILIVSTSPTHHWELYPESRLDERHVAYKEYPD